jgi:copper chaperone
VRGMSCGGCLKSVTSALQSSAGVAKVEVDLAGGTAKVDYDPALTNPQHLAEVIEDVGFSVNRAI